jgi:hypothetical protein
LSRSTAPYSTPRVLRPIELLDLLELSGTTTAVAEALGLSQPTVSRRTSHLVRDLGLRASADPPKPALRFGESSCLQHLRRACQAHRLEAGAWRLGSSPWQQSLLQPLQPWISVPGRFRHPEAWRSLVESHALDGAVVSGLDLQLALPEQPISGEHPVALGNCVLVPISRSPLGLLAPPSAAESPERWSQVAVPAQPLAPGLASLVRQQQWQCLHAAGSIHEPSAWGAWLRQNDKPAVASPAWAERLHPHLPEWLWQPWPQAESEQLWLLLLRSVWDAHPVLHTLLTHLRSATACDADAE